MTMKNAHDEISAVLLTDVCMYVCMDVCMDGWMDGWMEAGRPTPQTKSSSCTASMCVTVYQVVCPRGT